MKQREIKLPITCKTLIFGIWFGLTIVGSIYTIQNYISNGHLTSESFLPFTFTMVSLIVIGIFSAVIFGEWLRKKPRLPFKISCRCGND